MKAALRDPTVRGGIALALGGLDVVAVFFVLNQVLPGLWLLTGSVALFCGIGGFVFFKQVLPREEAEHGAP
jgi:hypothetical protein